MRLSQVFARCRKLAPLIEEACAVDEPGQFKTLMANTPFEPRQLLLRRAVRASALRFAEKAGVAIEPWPDQAVRPCFAGQQPYIDYYPAVLAKLDALEECSDAPFYAFADYAPLGSDPWMARTALPSASASDGLLPLKFYRSMQAQQGKDLRFVPPPASAVLADLTEKLKGMITHTAKWLPHESFSKKDAFARLRLLMIDYEEARGRARNAGEFNSLWSARVFHRLGFRLPIVSLSELLSSDELLPSIAATLAVFIEHNDLFIESINEAMQFDEGGDLNFSSKSPGHLPLALADPQSGVRRFLRLERSGADYLLVGTKGMEEVFNVGRADVGALEELLRRLTGRWSLDVFAPLFLFRLGIAGIINGRGSIRYSLVLGHVMQRLFGESHAPNLLCSCSPKLAGPFVEAVCRAHGRLPDSLRSREPTLISRLLSSDEPRIREEISASWRGGAQE
jgi:hypothetical protein